MFEIAIDSLRRARVRIGRWHLRTWRSPVMLLPKEYRAPELVYVVEAHDDRESHTQLGAFFNEHEARNCIARLEADGHTDLIINMIPVHLRVQDWEFDREAQGQKGTRLPVAGGAPTTRNALF